MGDSLALGDVVRHSLQLAFSAYRALMTAFRGLSVMGNRKCPIDATSSRFAHAPHGVSNIVRDEECPAPVQGEAHGSSVNRLVVLAEEAGDDRERLTNRSAVHERHENDLVAAQGTAVPTAMLTDESAVVEGRRQALTCAEQQA